MTKYLPANIPHFELKPIVKQSKEKCRCLRLTRTPFFLDKTHKYIKNVCINDVQLLIRYLVCLFFIFNGIVQIHLVCYFSYLSLVMLYHGCRIFYIPFGVLLNSETSTLMEFCQKLVDN